jgi:hypothetical protein
MLFSVARSHLKGSALYFSLSGLFYTQPIYWESCTISTPGDSMDNVGFKLPYQLNPRQHKFSPRYYQTVDAPDYFEISIALIKPWVTWYYHVSTALAHPCAKFISCPAQRSPNAQGDATTCTKALAALS